MRYIYPTILAILLIAVWFLLAIDGTLAKFDAKQWFVLLFLTGLAGFGIFISLYITKK